MVKFLLILAIVVLFVGLSFTAIFNLGKVVNQVLQVYVFQVERCEYVYQPAPEKGVMERPDEKCVVDYNYAKREVAEGLAYFLIASPLAYLFGRKVYSELVRT